MFAQAISDAPIADHGILRSVALLTAVVVLVVGIPWWAQTNKMGTAGLFARIRERGSLDQIVFVAVCILIGVIAVLALEDRILRWAGRHVLAANAFEPGVVCLLAGAALYAYALMRLADTEPRTFIGLPLAKPRKAVLDLANTLFGAAVGLLASVFLDGAGWLLVTALAVPLAVWLVVNIETGSEEQAVAALDEDDLGA